MITMELIFGCMFAVLMSAGGIGGIIIAVTKWSSGIIADRLSKSYQLQLDKELEKYKHNLENRRYVTQTQYDIEFSVYRDLTKSLFLVVKIVSEMLDEEFRGLFNDKELLEYEIKKGDYIHKSILDLQDKVFENAPFIPKHLFEKYEKVSFMANELLVKRLFNLQRLLEGDSVIKGVNDIMSAEEREKAKFIIESYKKLNDELRDYLKMIRIVD